MRCMVILSAVLSATLMCGLLMAAEQPTSRFVDIGGARLNLVEWWPPSGDGELIIALPGAGGDYTRYQRIAPLIAAAGYHLVVVNQRGIMGSTGSSADLTLEDLAGDVIAIADALNAERFHMMGWAFGNRTSRMAATLFPDRIITVSLIAAGGLVPPLTESGDLERLLSNQSLPLAEKVRLARRTLFSPATSDELVLEFARTLQYWPEAQLAQQQANRNTPVGVWAGAGTAPLLMVMGEDDLTAPIANGYRMKAEYGERVTLKVIPGGGHVVGLEKPHETAAAITAFLNRYPLTQSSPVVC